MEGKLIKTENGYGLKDCELIAFVSSRRPEHKHHKLSLKNCQAIERGYDLDELAYNNSLSYTWLETDERDKALMYKYGVEGFKAGFQKALELMSDKKFSEEEVMLGWDAGVMSQAICFSNYFGLKREDELKKHRESYQRDLKPSSLQQTEWDVTFDPKEKDEEGRLILKRK